MSERRPDYKIKTRHVEDFGILKERSDMVMICLPIPPSANRYWRNFNGRVVVSAEAQAYKQSVRLLCGRLSPFSGDVRLNVVVYRARKSGDLDNYLKVTLDSLRGIVYPDDKAVVEIHALRYDDKYHPRVVLVAYEAE